MKKEQGPPDSLNALFYDPVVNRFEDESGYIVHDLHKWFGTWQLDKWKKTKLDTTIPDRNGELWEIFYNRNGSYGRCSHLCILCGSKCEIYDMLRNF